MTDKRRGLGRGLSALIATKGAEEGVRSLPVAQIEPNRLQPRSRFDEAGLEELAASIKAQGLIQPIIVSQTKKGTYTIVAGERRWRAAPRAGLVDVPVVVRELRDEREHLELALVENIQRADLNPVEEAEAFHSLQESFGLTQEEIATRVGKGRSAVANTLRLLRLPEEILEALRAGELTEGQARPLLAIEDEAAQLRLARRAIAEGLTARRMEELAALAGSPTRRRAEKPVEAHAAAAAERLTRELQTRVEIDRRRKGGIVKIHFHSEEELIRLFERLTRKGGGKS
jgi:ParB family transcriptional regulator, chromosome partitioning protein